MTAARPRAWVAAALAGALVTGPAGAPAAVEEPPTRALTGTLKRIKETGTVRIGYRDAAVPFSFAGPGGRPYGYSIDICQAIVEQIAEAVGGTALRTEYARVTASDRIEQVSAGRVDLECGSTTNTPERRERVAFSPVTFFAGTRLLVKRGSPVRSVRDLPGRRVVVARGTTNEDVMRRLAAAPGRSFGVTAAGDYAGALQVLATGEADALAADDVLIAALLAERRLREEYAMVGDLLSFEPYGIAFARGDAPLAGTVDAAFRRLAASRELRWIYVRWFLQPLPSGVRLGLPMDARLERAFAVLGLPPE